MRVKSEASLADEFIKLCMIRARARGDVVLAGNIAREMGKHGLITSLVARCATERSWSDVCTNWFGLGKALVDRTKFEALVRRAAVAVGTSGDAEWAGPLVGITMLQEAFFQSLRNYCATDFLLQNGVMPVKPNTMFAVTTATGTGSGSVQEAQWLPATRLSFSSGDTTPSRAFALVVCSEDLLRFGGELATNMLGAELRRAVALATDQISIGILTAGLSPIGSTGDLRKDVREGLAEINLGQFSKPCVLMSPAMMKQGACMGDDTTPPIFPDLMLPNGGSIAGMPAIAVDALSNYAGFGSPASDCLLLVDAAQLAGDAGALDYLPSNQGSLEMVTNPSVGSPEDEPIAAELVSLFQTNSVGLRMTRWFNLTRVRQSACAVVTGCNYSVA